jgi:hypothetical protein
MAMPKVTMESSTCRSGPKRERVVLTRPWGLAGISSCAFSDEECVACEDTTDMMLPAEARAALEVVEPTLTLEVLVGALGAPSLLDS